MIKNNLKALLAHIFITFIYFIASMSILAILDIFLYLIIALLGRKDMADTIVNSLQIILLSILYFAYGIVSNKVHFLRFEDMGTKFKNFLSVSFLAFINVFALCVGKALQLDISSTPNTDYTDLIFKGILASNYYAGILAELARDGSMLYYLNFAIGSILPEIFLWLGFEVSLKENGHKKEAQSLQNS